MSFDLNNINHPENRSRLPQGQSTQFNQTPVVIATAGTLVITATFQDPVYIDPKACGTPPVAPLPFVTTPPGIAQTSASLGAGGVLTVTFASAPGAVSLPQNCPQIRNAVGGSNAASTPAGT
jgi:hypothetical protein